MITLNSQKYEVFKIAKILGLNPDDFSWTGKSTTYGAQEIIKYLDTNYFFAIDHDLSRGYTICNYSPGKESLHESKSTKNSSLKKGGMESFYPWDDIFKFIRNWLNNLKRETDILPFWSELKDHKLFPEPITMYEMPNEPFSKPEIDKITKGLQEVRAYLSEHIKSSKQHTDFINERIEYLIDSAKRLGKKDWFHILIGVFSSIITALALSPEEGKAIWKIFRESLRALNLLP